MSPADLPAVLFFLYLPQRLSAVSFSCTSPSLPAAPFSLYLSQSFRQHHFFYISPQNLSAASIFLYFPQTFRLSHFPVPLCKPPGCFTFPASPSKNSRLFHFGHLIFPVPLPIIPTASFFYTSPKTFRLSHFPCILPCLPTVSFPCTLPCLPATSFFLYLPQTLRLPHFPCTSPKPSGCLILPYPPFSQKTRNRFKFTYVLSYPGISRIRSRRPQYRLCSV